MIEAVDRETKAFELAQRKAKVYAMSTLVPKEYQQNIGNVMIAQNMAHRLGADLLQVMQNLYIVHGRPGWSAQFLIATFNQCGRFSPIKYKFTGERGKESWGCIAYATDRENGETVEGSEVTIGMAKAEGWSTKNGSKWKTMPEQMLRYRAASFLIRTVAPEVSMGLMTSEELHDMPQDSMTVDASSVKRGVAGLEERLGVGAADEEPTEPVALLTRDTLTTHGQAYYSDMVHASTEDEIAAISEEVDRDERLSDEDREGLRNLAEALFAEVAG